MAKIIAEFCQNHNGDLAILKDMIWSAAEAGAAFAKIQSILADDLSYRNRFESGVEENGERKTIKRPYQIEYERLKPLDLDDDSHYWFIEECQRAGIIPLTTVFSRSRIPFIASLPWEIVKVASYDCASKPLLRDLKGCFRHLFISTGSTHDHEISEAAKLLAGHSYSFFHCVTIYPTPLAEMHLARLEYLRKFSPSIGFSDHSLVVRDGIKASIVAIMLGVEYIERHFTILPSDQTRDGPVSINPYQLEDCVKFSKLPRDEVRAYVDEHIPEYPIMMGQERRELSDEELSNRDYYRGRFASNIGYQTIYNWEHVDIDFE
jgi:N,N'-diacetyllegionaminate synthase